MSAGDPGTTRGAAWAATRRRAGTIFLQFGMVWAFVILVIAASIVYSGFFDPQNLKNVFAQSASVGIVAVGMTFVMIGGGFDLSVGAVFALGAVFFANRADPFGLWGAAAIVLLVSLACGIINGFIVTKLRVNPFVATLGTGSAFGGAAYIYSKSAPQTPSHDGFQTLGTGYALGLPLSGWVMLAVFLVGALVLSRTTYGRSIYAIGGNNEAARLAGLRVDALRGSTYVLAAVCSGIGGMILSSKLGVGQADMGGTIALDAIAIVVIGGTSLLGGEGAMWRTAIGLLTIATLTNVFDSLAVSSNYQLVAKGSIVVGAVALDVFARSRR